MASKSRSDKFKERYLKKLHMSPKNDSSSEDDTGYSNHHKRENRTKKYPNKKGDMPPGVQSHDLINIYNGKQVKNRRNAKKCEAEPPSSGVESQESYTKLSNSKYDDSDEGSEGSLAEEHCPDMYRCFLGPTMDESILLFLKYFCEAVTKMEVFANFSNQLHTKPSRRYSRKCNKKSIIDVDISL